jgi:Transglycosylase SLT domain
MTHGRGLAAAIGTVAAIVMALGVAVLPADAAVVAGPTRAKAAAELAVIPAHYLTWYRAAARTCRGLTWEVLAGIGTMESNNGRSHARGVHKGKNREGAEGPMQFEPATFREYAVRADRSARLSPYNPEDAIFTAARMLCDDGAVRDTAKGVRGAIFAYNHSHRYVRDVLAIAARYTAAERVLQRHRRHRAARHLPGAASGACESAGPWVGCGLWHSSNAMS